MLTSDLVRVRRRKGELQVIALREEERGIAVDVGQRYVEVTEAHLGETRERWERACAAVSVPARGRKVAAGLRKLVEDRCTFAMDEGIEPAELRAEVFTLAAVRRAELESGEHLQREVVLAEVAAARSMSAEEVEGRLYGDLKRARRLQEFKGLAGSELVQRYEQSQNQAVLLRATQVVVTLHDAGPAALRRLFHKLKFLRLLHVVTPRKGGGHRLEVDGPLALFGPTTKYGLQLALLVPVLERTGRYSLEANVLWGPGKEPCLFKTEGGTEDDGAGADTTSRDDIDTLVLRLKAKKSGWRIRRSTRVLNLPGIGLCVPDLVFTRDGSKVYLEVMGYWSREAVWKRVDLVEGGLKERILFCVSSRLRVSEAVLGDDVPSSLYVYKGVMSAAAVLKKVDELAAR